MAGLSPADIAAPIRSILSGYQNVSVLQATLKRVDLAAKKIEVDFGTIDYDYLLLACGVVALTLVILSGKSLHRPSRQFHKRPKFVVGY